MVDETDDGVDFVVAAFRGDTEWQVEAMIPAAGDDLPMLLSALGQLSGGGEVLGFVSVADDFFVLARIGGTTRLFLSDITAATEWPLAEEVLEHLDNLDIASPDDDDSDDERVEPAGDLAIFADLGLDEMELAALCADIDLYPDQVLGSIATRLGFGAQFQRAVDDGSD